MDCGFVRDDISRGLKKQVGVIDADVNYANGKAYVEFWWGEDWWEKNQGGCKKIGFKVI